MIRKNIVQLLLISVKMNDYIIDISSIFLRN